MVVKRATVAVIGESPGEPVVVEQRLPDLVAASAVLRAWATTSIDRGTQTVREQQVRLRDAGVVDAEMRRVVDLPHDMRPSSRTDV